ncbi:hypothetical protein Pla52o_01180 [Novipirellula galeiformis]|uniref:Sulfatase n=1 Tax=Novipirellula galeiformis TaxID=2528004 RepID=A0A5C6CQU8_9BACT|nr:DUF1501 domain-containing protein [Novipirellula galeiformis]TWU26265.1 hypothetical protein Pla52o_01180 [Novipirellula galeiformis]
MISRRTMLQTASCGFGHLALQSLCQFPTRALAMDATARSNDVAIGPRAKRVIFLCMSGGPAQMDTFDYKPQTGKKKHPGSVFSFAQRGESGLWISELLPETAKHADRLCVINGMHADTGNHAQSFLQLHTGEKLRKRPSMGSWISYGLGTENANLPGFVSLNAAKPSVYSSVFLPTEFAGTPIGTNGEDMSRATIRDIEGSHLPTEIKRSQLDFVQTMNRDHFANRPGDAELEGVIESMELAFRMQSTAPELLDLSNETEATLKRYRVGKKLSIGTCRPTDFGRQCLLARRFAEAGVRFIEVNHGGWDQHNHHRRDLKANCETIDAPVAALLEDLAARGLLADTLVVWGGEFGRPGLVPDDGKDQTGHNHNGFTFWLAGGGVKAGYTHGKTNETGARAVEDKVHFRDLHATILHALGLDHANLTFEHGGRHHRLTGPENAKVVHDLFA